MTATAIERRIAAIEAAPEAPESYAATVERMARAIWKATDGEASGLPWDRVSELYHRRYRRLAEAALRVVTEPVDGALPGSVDQLTREHFGCWVEISTRQVAGVHTACVVTTDRPAVGEGQLTMDGPR